MNKSDVKWISVEDALPEIGEEVFVVGHYSNSPNFLAPIFTNKRSENSNVTDGNGFYRLSDHENIIITHWFYFPEF